MKAFAFSPLPPTGNSRWTTAELETEGIKRVNFLLLKIYQLRSFITPTSYFTIRVQQMQREGERAGEGSPCGSRARARPTCQSPGRKVPPYPLHSPALVRFMMMLSGWSPYNKNMRYLNEHLSVSFPPQVGVHCLPLIVCRIEY